MFKQLLLAETHKPATIGLHVLAPPHSQGAHSALRFAETTVDLGHHISLIFFNAQGVLNAHPVGADHQEHYGLYNATQQTWQSLAKRSGTQLSVCTGSAEHYGLSPSQLNSPWVAASLGDYLTACDQADQMVTFKP